jgi:hypothetical protein
MMNTAMKECLLEFEPQSNRICKIRLKGKFRNVTVISAHAPTNEKDDQEKESFYENLEEVYNRIPRYDMVIIRTVICMHLHIFPSTKTSCINKLYMF